MMKQEVREIEDVSPLACTCPRCPGCRSDRLHRTGSGSWCCCSCGRRLTPASGRDLVTEGSEPGCTSRSHSRRLKKQANSHIWLPTVSAAPDLLPIEGHVTNDKRMSRDIRLEEETEAADLDLPTSQRPSGIGSSVGFRACRNLDVLQGELALQS